MKTFTFNGTSAASVGLVASGGQTYNSPARAQDVVQVPGRNGDLILDGGRWKNIPVTYHVYSIGLQDNRDDIANWLMAPGYHRLQDNWNPGVYRLAYFEGPAEWDTFLAKHGETDLEFNAKPQRFLTAGETPVSFSSSGTITNPTQYVSRPLIRATGTGSFTINGTTVTITTADGYTDIDSEMMDCFKGSTNCNLNVTLDEFPTLAPGSNSVTLSGITSLVITPRWFEL